MKVIDDVELAMTLASVLPPAINYIEAELPTEVAEVKADYETVSAPAQQIITDVELDIKGGAANVVTENVEKTVADLESLVVAVTAIIPKIEADAEGEYGKLYPILLPLMTALKIKLPAVPAPTPAPTPAA